MILSNSLNPILNPCLIRIDCHLSVCRISIVMIVIGKINKYRILICFVTIQILLMSIFHIRTTSTDTPIRGKIFFQFETIFMSKSGQSLKLLAGSFPFPHIRILLIGFARTDNAPSGGFALRNKTIMNKRTPTPDKTILKNVLWGYIDFT